MLPCGFLLAVKITIGYWWFILCNVLLTLYHTIPTFTNPTKEPFENIVGKGENAGDQHFLLFPQCFLPFTKQILN